MDCRTALPYDPNRDVTQRDGASEQGGAERKAYEQEYIYRRAIGCSHMVAERLAEQKRAEQEGRVSETVGRITFGFVPERNSSVADYPEAVREALALPQQPPEPPEVAFVREMVRCAEERKCFGCVYEKHLTCDDECTYIAHAWRAWQAASND